MKRVIHIRLSGAMRYKCGAPLFKSTPPKHRPQFVDDADAMSVPVCPACAALSPVIGGVN